MDGAEERATVVLQSVPLPKESADRLVVFDEEEWEKRHRRYVMTARIVVGIAMIGLWELLSRIGWLNAYYWSRPSMIVQTAWIQLIQGTLLSDILYTSGSTLIGFVSGTLVGAAVGLSFWWSRSYAEVSEPFLILLNAMPKLALAPVLVILLGIGFFSKIALAFLMTVIVTALSAYSGVKSLDADMERLLYSLGAQRRHVFFKVVVPWSMPWIISSLRINIALALAGAIVGEFIASQEGVGRMILYAGTILDIPLVWVGVVALSILSMVMYSGVVTLEKWLSTRLPKS